ncbi:hypothetical protein [Desulfonatronovibrio magnus]|uniref:hypothetical protein n=1 Tax=Desulfonatronovibrio magnus TaxID=698827 RepID=UPI0005EB58FE|nr:hypothetical protein [Desulfonatronovibrio magnus]
MRLVKFCFFFLAALLVFSVSTPAEADAENLPTVNTRGACLNTNEFVGLIMHESQRLKNGDNMRLIADIPNEPEAREAIAKSGYVLLDEERNELDDYLNFLLEVKK